MKRIWTFLNSPLVALLLAEIALVALVVFALLRFPLFSGEEENRAEALSRLQLISMTPVTNKAGRIEKYIGTVRNNSDYIISNVSVALCLFDAKGNLSDVVRQPLNEVGLLSPKQEAAFSVPMMKDNGENVWTVTWTPVEGFKVELRFIDLQATKTTRD